MLRHKRIKHGTGLFPQPPLKPLEKKTPSLSHGFRFQHPFTMIVSGPTSCGKTYFVKTMLQQNQSMYHPTAQRIVWLYKRWQPLYDEIQRTVVPRVEFMKGIPFDLDSDDFFDSTQVC